MEAEFVELEYNKIPLFIEEEENKDGEKTVKKEYLKRNWYTNRIDLKPEDTLNRLKRKYQQYKSAYYLDQK